MLSERDVERIASRVAALLNEATGQSGGRLVSARELAQILGVSCGYVYANSEALGARRLGGGPKGRLRFEPALARERLERIGSAQAVRPSASPADNASDLPIYDLA